MKLADDATLVEPWPRPRRKRSDAKYPRYRCDARLPVRSHSRQGARHGALDIWRARRQRIARSRAAIGAAYRGGKKPHLYNRDVEKVVNSVQGDLKISRPVEPSPPLIAKVSHELERPGLTC
jgi:hypothetical protein